ncbi:MULTISPECIES: FprA family A-type flavoprotein [Jonquetella]|uniref:Putative flavoprotein n=1 Tax=Jonquetella anthropi DSM 22815 TaxID=885272 RepID=H0UIU9_9BACT|nr:MULTISPECIES: FprA family A-type flavoprotein [Jonquetella]EEX48972.1 metallo-beta-lactamase domain protein [Jonquetella anthropi E3_33 E1]EHM12743.1 putative flavoprotein [Jonquetella anthropi DSM 22815]ERL23461.1 metallo-beta-lactamase domain protein [Jonquetella sp. BV3C21]
MQTAVITDRIWWVGVNDRTTARFENLWPLKRGVCYNSYLIDDEKVALIDGARAGFLDDYLGHIESALGKDRQVDYLIVNHMEPDHSSAISMLRRRFPRMTVVGNKQTLQLMRQFYGPIDGTLQVGEGDRLELGSHVLKFILAPMVHWPETMFSWEETTGTLFPCDAFGSYGALDGSVFDDENDLDNLESETRRYYATIVGRFGPFVQKALAKCKDLPIQRICPSHGPIYRSHVSRIVSLYDRLSRQETVPGAVLAYGSMYGHTAQMAEACAQGLREKGILSVKIYDVCGSDLSEVIADVWRYRGLGLFACCYNMGLFPGMMPLLEKLRNCKVSDRILALGGNYSWSKGLELKPLIEFAQEGKFVMASDPIEIQSAATPEQLEACREAGRRMAEMMAQAPQA